MTVDEAVRVARIINHQALFIGNASASKMIALVLLEFPEVSWSDFFNNTDSFIDEGLHDRVFEQLEQLRNLSGRR